MFHRACRVGIVDRETEINLGAWREVPEQRSEPKYVDVVT